MPLILKDSAVLVALITVGGGLIGTLISVLANFFVNREKKTTKSQYDVITEKIEALGGQVLEVNETVQTNKKKLESLDDSTAKIQRAEKKTQRYRLFEDLTKEIAKGYTTIERFRELSILFESYKELGGNGEIEALYREYTKLEKQIH